MAPLTAPTFTCPECGAEVEVPLQVESVGPDGEVVLSGDAEAAYVGHALEAHG